MSLLVSVSWQTICLLPFTASVEMTLEKKEEPPLEPPRRRQSHRYSKSYIWHVNIELEQYAIFLSYSLVSLDRAEEA